MQRALPFALSGVNPQTPKKALLSTATLSSLLGRAEVDTQATHCCVASHAQGHWWVAHRMASHSGWLVDNHAPRREEGALANIHPRATKSHSWNIAKETAHPSVGRSLSAGHHRLILPLCRLRLNAPPQDRLHRSNVTMLARAIAQYTAP